MAYSIDKDISDRLPLFIMKLADDRSDVFTNSSRRYALLIARVSLPVTSKPASKMA